ncbi:hypothetical protein ACP4OV_022304 [Aristida adscensionis]
MATATATRVRGRRLLATAAALLALPAHAAGARLRLARGTLWEASVELARAASAATAAELLALRGGAGNTTPPPPPPAVSIRDVPNGCLLVRRLALSLLRSARGCADDACDSVQVQRFYGHLRTAANLLDGSRLLGVEGFLDAERAAARGELKAAKDLAMVTITAHWFVH